MNEIESTLRTVLADRADAVAPPTGVYAAVRRRHRRRQRAVVGGTLVAVAVVGVPALALQHRPDQDPTATAAATATRPPSGPDPAAAIPCVLSSTRPAAGLRPQRDVAGSLGGDPQVVQAVLRAGWNDLSAASNRHADPSTARVRMVTRTEDGWIVGAVTSTSLGGGWPGQMVVSGPDIDHLSTDQAGIAVGDEPLDTEYFGGDAFLGQTGCHRTRYVVVAPPGSTGTVGTVTDIAADLTLTPAPVDIPFRADGVAAFTPPFFGAALVQIRKDGRVIRSLNLGETPKRGRTPDTAAVLRALGQAPGDGDVGAAQEVLAYQPRSLPVDRTDVRVLWKGTTAAGQTVVVAVAALPSGARYVWGGVKDGRRISTFDGLLAADRWDRTVLTFRLPVKDHPLAIVVAGEAEVHVRHGDATGVENVTGGKIDPNGDGAVVTAFTRDGDRTPLQVVSTADLTPAPGPNT